MFKKLRIKFIAITMVMVAVVMALAFSVVCAIEYQRSLSVVQTSLDDAVNQAMIEGQRGKWFAGGQEGRFVPDQANAEGQATESSESSGVEAPDGAAENGANQMSGKPDRLPDGFVVGQGPRGNGGVSTSSSSGAVDGQSETSQDGSASDTIVPPEIGNRRNQPRSSNTLIPVAVYRYESDGSAMVIPHVTTASISDEVLADAIDGVKGSAAGFGTLADLALHYQKAERDGVTYLAFADTSYTDSWKSLALMLVVVGIATLAVFFVIALFYSRWALKPVREAWDSQRQFVADASHDLKTPLTVILANSAILLKHPEHSIASESQWVESTQKEAETMQGLVNEMLELAQVEAGDKVEIEKDQLDLSDLVDGQTLMFDAVALERNCTFECDVDGGISLLGNEKQIEKMVSTLIENAFKYVDDGGEVEISLHATGKNAVLSIRNTGSIISAEDLPHIFDRFYRTDKARTSGEGGFGLGLAIAREIARQHGGDITCASNESAGTTFTVTLPL